MRDRDGQRIGCVFRLRRCFRQQHADHHPDLAFFAVAGADDGFLDQVRRIFGDGHAGLRRNQQRDTARLPELEGRRRILVDEGGLNSRFLRLVIGEHPGEPRVNGHQTDGNVLTLTRLDRAASDEDQPIAQHVDDAPPGAAEARIDPQDANQRRTHAAFILRRKASRQSVGDPAARIG